MFIFRVFILYFTACTIDIDEFIKISFSILKYYAALNLILMGSTLYIHRTVCFIYYVWTCKFINDLKVEISTFILFCIRFFVPSESILLYCCCYYYHCYYYLPYDDQSCEHFQHVVTSFAQNMKIGMGC